MTPKPAYILALLALLPPCAMGGADSGTVVAAGYRLLTGITAAPGQVLTILVQGIGAPQQELSAGADGWPATLAGISVTLTAETAVGAGLTALPVPIGSVFPFSNCVPGGSSCATLTGLTLQVPFEMYAPPSSTRLSVPVPSAVLKIVDQGGHTASIFVNPISDQVHIVRSLDTIAGGYGGGVPAVTHADGSAVSALSPAKPGETLVMYAAGLGATSPPATDGMPSPFTPLALAQQAFRLHYDFEPNASPSPGVPGTSTLDSVPSPAPIFVGMTPGFIGLYQVNFTIIGPPSGTLPCGGPVSSNMTVTLVGASSFDGAGICVDTAGP